MTEKKRSIRSDLAKVDDHRIDTAEYEDAPEIDEAFLDAAEIRHGDKVVRRGRPPLAHPRQAITLRLDADVVEKFKATGPGWRSRINAVLKQSKV